MKSKRRKESFVVKQKKKQLQSEIDKIMFRLQMMNGSDEVKRIYRTRNMTIESEEEKLLHLKEKMRLL